MKVTGCFIYPLKSGKPISLDRMELNRRGPRYDRLWMLVHDEPSRRGLFITQREKGCAILARVTAKPDPNGDISFAAPGSGRLTVHFNSLVNFESPVEIWGEYIEGMDAGDAAAEWFSNYLNLSCRLIRIPPDYIRSTEPEYSRKGDQVGFADKYPLHVTNEASLTKLQEHLPETAEVTMDRFRPNIVIEGLEPFEEDIIHEVRIGSVLTEFVKPSIRCSMTTIDQEKAIASSDEPLRTLGKVRKGKGGGLTGVFFGQNVIHRESGTIRVGDKVTILSKKSVHPALVDVSLGYTKLL